MGKRNLRSYHSVYSQIKYVQLTPPFLITLSIVIVLDKKYRRELDGGRSFYYSVLCVDPTA